MQGLSTSSSPSLSTIYIIYFECSCCRGGTGSRARCSAHGEPCTWMAHMLPALAIARTVCVCVCGGGVLPTERLVGDAVKRQRQRRGMSRQYGNAPFSRPRSTSLSAGCERHQCRGDEVASEVSKCTGERLNCLTVLACPHINNTRDSGERPRSVVLTQNISASPSVSVLCDKRRALYPKHTIVNCHAPMAVTYTMHTHASTRTNARACPPAQHAH